MTEPTQYTITLPAGLTLINSNHREHHQWRATAVRALRTAARTAAVDCLGDLLSEPPLCRRAIIWGWLYPPDRRRRDPANWYPSFKAAVDGLVDAGVLEDDDSDHLIGPDMRLGREVVPGGQLVLVVRPLGGQWWDDVREGRMP